MLLNQPTCIAGVGAKFQAAAVGGEGVGHCAHVPLQHPQVVVRLHIARRSQQRACKTGCTGKKHKSITMFLLQHPRMLCSACRGAASSTCKCAADAAQKAAQGHAAPSHANVAMSLTRLRDAAQRMTCWAQHSRAQAMPAQNQAPLRSCERRTLQQLQGFGHAALCRVHHRQVVEALQHQPQTSARCGA